MTSEEGWQRTCTGTFHFFKKNRKISWCGGVGRDDACDGPWPITSGYAINRGCPHCIGSTMLKPAKWQKQSRSSKKR